MHKPYLVTICVREYFEIEIQAPDDQCIFKFKDPEYARWLPGASADKLNNPELYRSYSKREIDLCSVEEVMNDD